ncbi:unnamed protein product [Chondrus crispus]|uniref:CCHC-type domain-containing protein n=1 Tax=Chondrus crispus TaxID=2769 RepID=R7QUL7_CHOCR|nr:unnamed protein product [Chondrus crispus]CDF41020.1 unnamed protein product [Chondrus crispus]|eukprot:XP_005711314.1 unnamed protein product [Chondrus crispus]
MSAWRVPSQAGRPKKRRKQGVAAPQRKSRCSACGQVGHYATTCEAPDTMYVPLPENRLGVR